MSTPGLVVTHSDAILTIRFDRPEAFNAFSGEMVLETSRLLEEASARDDVRVVVLPGTGPAFSTGADIGGESAPERRAAVRRVGREGVRTGRVRRCAEY